MSTPSRAPLRAFARRKVPRCPLAVPVRVTVLRSGTAYSIPGRSLDLGEGGIAVVLAGEVRAADRVGVEFLLPDLGLGLQAKAVVRHQAALRCGCEFEGLTRHQLAVIREWTRQRLETKPQQTPNASAEQDPGQEPEPEMDQASPETPSGEVSRFRGMRVPRLAWAAVAVLVLAGVLLWLHWERAWHDLEKQIPRATGQVTTAEPNFLAALDTSGIEFPRELAA